MADEARLHELLDLVEQSRQEGDTVTEQKATAAYKRESQAQQPVSALSRASAVPAGVNSTVLNTLGLPMTTLANAGNLASVGMGYLHSKITGEAPPALYNPADQADIPLTGAWLNRLFNSTPAGNVSENPNPQDKASRYLYAGGVGAGAALFPAQGARILPNLVAGVAGAEGQQIAAENGAGPATQAVAGLASSFIPSGARYGLQEGLRLAARGRDPQVMRQNIADFQAAGTNPSVGQASGNRRMQATETLLSRAPGGAGVMANRAEAQGQQIGGKIEQTAKNLSFRSSPEEAGRAIQRGIADEGGFVDQFKQKRTELYDELDKHIQADTRIPVTNTRGALQSLTGDIPGAPNVSRNLQNKRINSIKGDFENDLSIPTSEQKSLNSTLAKIDELYASRNAARQDEGRFMAFENHQRNQIGATTEGGAPLYVGSTKDFARNERAGRSATQDANLTASMRNREARDLESVVGDLQSAAQQSGGKLPYEAVKKLRTMVGEELDSNSLTSDVPRAKWNRLYASLSSDMQNAAKAAGPAATNAWNRANTYNRVGMQRIKQLDDIVDKNGGPEKVFQAATSGSKEGATVLRSVMRSLPADAQKSVSAAMLRRLGRAKPGQQNDVGDKFSTETFLTNWNSLSPEAKSTLFDRYGPSFRGDMDAISRVASNLRSGSKVFANPSGTSQGVTQATAATTFIGALFTGHPGIAAGVAGGVGGSNLAARALTNPNVVKWLAGTTRATSDKLPVILAQAAYSNDPDIQEIARLVRKQQ